MITMGPLARAVAAAGLVVATAGMVAPAFAGPAELALLRSYEGSWKGTGQVVGTDTSSVTCRMSLTDGNDQKVNYAGRCAIAGANLSINGTLAYIEENHRYEGAMTSNVNFSGVAVGQKKGSGIVFNLQSKGMNEGKTIDISASITLTPGVISVNFRATDPSTGKMINATVPFSKT